MIHLFKHKDGKFDIAFVANGKFIWGSNQHYERKVGCYKAIRRTMLEFGAETCRIQDDVVYALFDITRNSIKKLNGSPTKPYIPNKKIQ